MRFRLFFLGDSVRDTSIRGDISQDGVIDTIWGFWYFSIQNWEIEITDRFMRMVMVVVIGKVQWFPLQRGWFGRIQEGVDQSKICLDFFQYRKYQISYHQWIRYVLFLWWSLLGDSVFRNTKILLFSLDDFMIREGSHHLGYLLNQKTQQSKGLCKVFVVLLIFG